MIAPSKGGTTPSDNIVANGVEIEALEDVRNRRGRLTGALAHRFSELQELGWASGTFKETLNKQPFAGNARLILVDETLVNRVSS